MMAIAKRVQLEIRCLMTVSLVRNLLRPVAEQIRKAGGQGIFVRTDVGEEGDVKTLLQSAWAQYGRIDVLYNNAAVLFHESDARTHELSLESWVMLCGMVTRKSRSLHYASLRSQDDKGEDSAHLSSGV
jgi:NAD(P)-dependent dehydrogenase (short-subunit alcohol dehydrogenase family)